MRLVEVTETLKTERMTCEKTSESQKREKELELQKVADDLLQLKHELTKAVSVNESLQVELQGMSKLRDKYDDLKAEWMTLSQTN